MMDDVVRHDDKHTGESYVLKVRETLNVPTMNYNHIPSHVTREVGIDTKTAPKFK